ncbi:uncharacterized protein LOC144224630 [Crocuta crocuta]
MVWKQMIFLLGCHQKVNSSLVLPHSACIIHRTLSHHAGILSPIITARRQLLLVTHRMETNDVFVCRNLTLHHDAYVIHLTSSQHFSVLSHIITRRNSFQKCCTTAEKEREQREHMQQAVRQEPVVGSGGQRTGSPADASPTLLSLSNLSLKPPLEAKEERSL